MSKFGYTISEVELGSLVRGIRAFNRDQNEIISLKYKNGKDMLVPFNPFLKLLLNVSKTWQ